MNADSRIILRLTGSYATVRCWISRVDKIQCNGSKGALITERTPTRNIPITYTVKESYKEVCDLILEKL